MSCGVHLDSSLDMMEETRFKKKHAALILKLSKELHFTYTEVESIMLIYYKVQKSREGKQNSMSQAQFREILHSTFDMTDSELNDIIISVLETSRSLVYHEISMEAWAKTLSLFLRGTLEEKIAHCYRVYDHLGEGKISRDAMLHLLRQSLVGEEDVEDAVKDLIEVITKKMDIDRDGKISYNDYKQTVLSHPLMLEAFGQCLPSRLAAHAFITTFTTKTGKV